MDAETIAKALADLHALARDLRSILQEVREVTAYMKDAESEVPEKMRRFIMYFHDAHDLKNLYHESGIEPPKWVLKEIERCADRYRHLLQEMYSETGAFERVRRDMTEREGNRYDWSMQLKPPEKYEHETRNG